MADSTNNQLGTSTNSSSLQASTQSPQTANGSSFGASQTSGGVQPGTSSNVLSNNQAGTNLNSSGVGGISLNSISSSANTTSTIQATDSLKPKHHVSGVFLGFAGALILVAIVLSVVVQRSVKSTT